MIVAYMNFFSLQNAWVNISQLLMRFFDFYGTKFDETKVGILVNRGGWYYPFNSLSDCPIVIKDPLNIENNIGKNTYRICEIKKEFVKAANQLEIEKSMFLKLTDDQIYEIDEKLKCKESDNWIEKMMLLSKFLCSLEEH